MQRTVWARVGFQCGLCSVIEASAPIEGGILSFLMEGTTCILLQCCCFSLSQVNSPFWKLAPRQMGTHQLLPPADAGGPTHSRLWLLRTTLQFVLLPLPQELSKFIPQNMSDLCFYSHLLLIVLPVRFFFLIIDISISF